MTPNSYEDLEARLRKEAGMRHGDGVEESLEWEAADALADLRKQRDDAKAHIEQVHAKYTCMCGSLVDEHGIGSGHSPVSMYDYALDQAETRAASLEAQLAEAQRLLELSAGQLYTIQNERERLEAQLEEARADAAQAIEMCEATNETARTYAAQWEEARAEVERLTRERDELHDALSGLTDWCGEGCPDGGFISLLEAKGALRGFRKTIPEASDA